MREHTAVAVVASCPESEVWLLGSGFMWGAVAQWRNKTPLLLVQRLPQERRLGTVGSWSAQRHLPPPSLPFYPWDPWRHWWLWRRENKISNNSTHLIIDVSECLMRCVVYPLSCLCACCVKCVITRKLIEALNHLMNKSHVKVISENHIHWTENRCQNFW